VNATAKTVPVVKSTVGGTSRVFTLAIYYCDASPNESDWTKRSVDDEISALPNETIRIPYRALEKFSESFHASASLRGHHINLIASSAEPHRIYINISYLMRESAISGVADRKRSQLISRGINVDNEVNSLKLSKILDSNQALTIYLCLPMMGTAPTVQMIYSTQKNRRSLLDMYTAMEKVNIVIDHTLSPCRLL
jgi:hypothetical protein